VPGTGTPGSLVREGGAVNYTGKPYDPMTGLYGYRDYAPELARFTTVDPVRDGADWFAYVNNDPVNWVDPWGLEDIVIWRALDAKHDTNWKLYDLFVKDTYRQIEKAAKEQGLTVKVINGQDATAQNLITALEDNGTKRVIILAHGKNSTTEAFVDVQQQDVSLQGVNIGSNLQTVDLVSCYANNANANQGVGLVQTHLGISDVGGIIRLVK
jgi:RHS repeat-associated protein